MDDFQIDLNTVKFPSGMHVILEEGKLAEGFNGVTPGVINEAINKLIKGYKDFEPNLRAWKILDGEFDELSDSFGLDTEEAVQAYKEAIAHILIAHVAGLVGESAALNFYMALINMKFSVDEISQ